MMCQHCQIKPATDKHHLFPQYKLHKKLYPDYIHHSDNFLYVCNDCHLSKSILKWDEIKFCLHFGIKPRTKSGVLLWRKRGLS